MTVIVAVRTGAAAVLAADSKLTTQAWAGNNADGTPRFLPQTYDKAVKIVRDFSNTSIAAFAGHGNIGEQTVTDYFSRIAADLHTDVANQDQRVNLIAAQMAQARVDFANRLGFAPDQTPDTIGILVAPPAGAVAPRLWRIQLHAAESSVAEILANPGVWFEGSAGSVMSLLYARSAPFAEGLRQALGVDEPAFTAAMNLQAQHLPILQINFWTMPLQEAMDFALFCCVVQIQMDRFLPGLAACGGPVDLMTLEMAPAPRLTAFPGKRLHHPVVISDLGAA